MKNTDPEKKLTPLKLLKRPGGGYSRKLDQGEEVLVSKKEDGSWGIYESGSSEYLGLWKSTPKPEKVNRGGLLGFFGLRRPEASKPRKVIDPKEVRELYFLENDIQGREIYRNVVLPKPPKKKPWKAIHYRIYMKLDPENQVVSSRATIEGCALKWSKEIPVDLGHFPADLKIVDEYGFRRRYERTEDGVTIRQEIAPNQKFSLEVHFEGNPEPVSHPGVPADLGWLSNPSSIVTFNGAARSSSWLPGDDNPNNKATYDFEVEVPNDHFAVANGDLVEERDLGNGYSIHHYRCRFPMASYLASVNVFERSKFCRTFVTESFDVIHPIAMKDRVLNEFRNHQKMMDFLVKRLGRYPFNNYGAIVTDLPVDSYKTRFTDGQNTYEADSKFEIAFEAQTRPIFQADSITGKGDFEATIIHEMAHQWFGNAVTNASEADVWVNEAFPSYSGWLWLEEQSGAEHFEREMEILYESIAHHEFTDTMAKPHRDKLFSQENYARMTLSMHALRRTLGDQQFFKTMWGAVDAHKYKSVDVVTLANTMNALNGGRLKDFFEAWLFQTEVPPYPKAKSSN